MRVGEAGGHESIPLELLALEFTLVLFFLATDFQAAAAYEFHNFAQLVAIEPGAVAFANIDDNARAMRKVNSIHQLTTLRTRRITNLAGLVAHRNLVRRRERSAAQNG